MGTGTARRLWALDGARLTMERGDMLDGAAPGPVRLVVPSFLIEPDNGLVLMAPGSHLARANEPEPPIRR